MFSKGIRHVREFLKSIQKGMGDVQNLLLDIPRQRGNYGIKEKNSRAPQYFGIASYSNLHWAVCAVRDRGSSASKTGFYSDKAFKNDCED